MKRAFALAEPAIKTEPTEPDGLGDFLSERESHVEMRLFDDGREWSSMSVSG